MTRSVTIFAMGQSANKHTEKMIRVESGMYRDIIQENFVDSYKNLSLKGIMWLKWATLHCPNAFYIVKVDDDIVVNIFNLARHLATLNGMPVLREQGSKWFVSKNEVENDTYPPYCSGSAYIITNDFVPVLYRKSFRTKLVWVDDAYITGFLPAGLAFEHVNLASLYVLRHEEIEAKLAAGYALFGHSPTSVNSRIRLWKKITAIRNIRL
uniref:Hexosyltransferase n=1 Tax=Romanomermis culicivorax TaxID=13658 RepID=A0A915KZX9_ROMCU